MGSDTGGSDGIGLGVAECFKAAGADVTAVDDSESRMNRLRQKLGDDPKNPAFIKTVWGAGYVFIGENPEDADRTD